MCVNIHGCIRFDTGGCDLVARQRQLRLALAFTGKGCLRSSGVARAFPGGQAAHPENQNEEEKE